MGRMDRLDAIDPGYSIRAWYFDARSNFALEMQTAAAKSARTIAVLSPHFLESEFTRVRVAGRVCRRSGRKEAKTRPVKSNEMRTRRTYYRRSFMSILSEALQVWRFDLISWADAPRPIDFRTVQESPV